MPLTSIDILGQHAAQTVIEVELPTTAETTTASTSVASVLEAVPMDVPINAIPQDVAVAEVPAVRSEVIQVTPTEAPPPPDPDVYAGLDIPNYKLWDDEVAPCESNGIVNINTGNGFYGTIQFTRDSWLGAGGGQFAPRADLATKEQQYYIGEKLLRMQGRGAWPVCAKGLPFNMRELRDPADTMNR